MTVNAVRSSEDPHHTSYLKSFTLGALTGYALKYVLPLTPQEKDDAYMRRLDAIKNNARNIRLKKIEILRAKESKDKAEELFLKLNDAGKLKNLGEQNLPEHLLSKVIEIRAKINNSALLVLDKGRRSLVALTKSIRPTGTFILTGAAVGLLIAFGNNIIYNTSAIETEI